MSIDTLNSTDYTHYKFYKEYYLKDHLGNIRLKFSDARLNLSTLEITGVYNYYPFGQLIDNKTWEKSTGRFGFQSQERDDEVLGKGNSVNYQARGYTPQTGDFTDIDPLASKFPGMSPYVTYGNNPILHVDPNGDVFFKGFFSKERRAGRDAGFSAGCDAFVDVALQPQNWDDVARESVGLTFGGMQYLVSGGDVSALLAFDAVNGTDATTTVLGLEDYAKDVWEAYETGNQYEMGKAEGAFMFQLVLAYTMAPKGKAKVKASNIHPRKVGNLKGGPLENARQVSGKFDLQNGPENGTLFRADNQGNVTSYVVYDGDGLALKRVDVTGKVHSDVPTPHVIEYKRNPGINPKTGRPTVDAKNTTQKPRKATPEEIP
jgi:RHS repeat-associated protein